MTTTTLRSADLGAVLHFAEDTLGVRDFDHVPQVLLAGLAGVVGCDAVTLTHLDLRSQREVAVFWPGPRAAADLAGYAEVGAAHPLREPLASQLVPGPRQRPPLRISDVLTARQWRSTVLYGATHRGLADQMCVLLAGRGSVVHAVTLSRTRRPFCDRQRDLLAACRRHVAVAVARARRDVRHQALQISPTVAWVPAQAAPGLPGVPAPRAGDSPVTGPAGVGALSPRERDVLALVASGRTDAQVARELGLRPATVSKHLHRVYSRLGLLNRVDAVRYWSRLPAHERGGLAA